MSTVKRVNIGILGCSKFAIRSMIPAIRELTDEYRLVGIASRRLAHAEQQAAAFQTRSFDGYQSLLDVPELEAVYIPLPIALHAEWIAMALERNLHVLVEKSLACTPDQVGHVHRLARDKQRVLLENFHFRFHQQLAWILDVIANGQIGALRCLRSAFGVPPFPDRDNIRYQKELGGGALLDVGAYPVKIAQILMGEDVSVRAAKLNMNSEQGVDLWGGAFLAQNRGDLFTEIAFGFDHYYQCSLEIWGSEGRLVTNRIFTCPRDVEPEIVIESQGKKEIHKLPADNQIRNLLIHFHRLACADGDVESEYRQNLNQARLIDELRRKAHES